MARRRTVTISKEEFDALPANRWERLVCQELRRHSIPVIGHLQFNGVKTGVLRMHRNDDGSATFDWWESAKAAADDGVLTTDSPRTLEKLQ